MYKVSSCARKFSRNNILWCSFFDKKTLNHLFFIINMFKIINYVICFSKNYKKKLE